MPTILKKHLYLGLLIVVNALVYYRIVGLVSPFINLSLFVASFIYLKIISIRKNNRYLFLSLFVIWMGVISFVFYWRYPDSSAFVLTNIEKHEITVKHDFLKIGLIGQLYGRKIGNFYFNRVLILRRLIIKNVSVVYDISRFFSSKSISMFPFWLLPFFLVGFVHLLKKNVWDIVFYFLLATAVSVFILPDQSPFLFMPMYLVVITAGFLKTFVFIDKLKIKIINEA